MTDTRWRNFSHTYTHWHNVHYTRHYACQVDTHFPLHPSRRPFPLFFPFVIVIDTALMSATLVGSVAQLTNSRHPLDSRLLPLDSRLPTLDSLSLSAYLAPSPSLSNVLCSVIAALLLINELLTRA